MHYSRCLSYLINNSLRKKNNNKHKTGLINEFTGSNMFHRGAHTIALWPGAQAANTMKDV